MPKRNKKPPVDPETVIPGIGPLGGKTYGWWQEVNRTVEAKYGRNQDADDTNSIDRAVSDNGSVGLGFGGG